MKLPLLRPKGKAIYFSSVITVLFLFVTRFSQLDAYTVQVSHAHTRATKATQHCSLRCQPAFLIQQRTRIDQSFFVLHADERGISNDSPKKKRRRKQPASSDTTSDQVQRSSVVDEEPNDTSTMNDIDLTMMNEIARYEFENKMDAPKLPNVVDDTINLFEPQQSTTSSAASTVSGAIPLPDIKEARKRKQMEEENARIQQEQDEQKVKIKRTDKEAFRRLLEQQPFADADESYFEEEQYGAVSALLGERAKPFLSIPLGPLQVGHFIGSLVFVLMAYIEYPGFPLTNLPTPLRECFQGGLGFVYAINAILAIVVAVKVAPDRGQPKSLWIMKTFTVGGLAFDQLMQLPTLAEIEKANAVKGSRALKKKLSTR